MFKQFHLKLVDQFTYIFLWTPTYGHTSAVRLVKIYIHQMQSTLNVVYMIWRECWTIGTAGEWGSSDSALFAQTDDDDDDDDVYIYMGKVVI